MSRLKSESFQTLSRAGGEDRVTSAPSRSQEDSFSLHWPERKQRSNFGSTGWKSKQILWKNSWVISKEGLDITPVLELNKTLSTGRAGICSLRTGWDLERQYRHLVCYFSSSPWLTSQKNTLFSTERWCFWEQGMEATPLTWKAGKMITYSNMPNFATAALGGIQGMHWEGLGSISWCVVSGFNDHCFKTNKK